VKPIAAPLSHREAQVARGIGRGLRNRQIAVELGITERTVKKHVANACRKIGAGSRLELALKVRAAQR
jgi:DNA-binding NarL/FixJ family response regulator